MGNIKTNIHRKIDCRIINDYYMDFMLSKDNVNMNMINNDDFAAMLSFDNINSRHVVSNTAWANAVKSDIVLKNIGYTGVDNGFITYERDIIGNDEFLELYTKSTFDLSTFNDKFFITEVNGNNGMLVYPIEKYNDYVSLKGGFYQGFFKLKNMKYQTLPHRIKDEWNFNITLRPQDYKTPSNILNKRYNENQGIFFFIGTRAENKFWELYKHNPEIKNFKYDETEDYYLDYDVMDSSVNNHQYYEKNGSQIIINPYSEDDFFEDDYFMEMFDEEENETNNEEEENYFSDDDYLKKQIDLTEVKLTDSKGYAIGEKDIIEIKTDNKFITFNRTENGFNKNTWSDDYEIILTSQTETQNINNFIYLNQTSTGYTKNNIHSLKKEIDKGYNIFKDIENNALALKLNEDGSISYRFLSKNCELIEEKTKPNLVDINKWYNIHLKIVKNNIDNSSINCDSNYKQGIMRLYIYINGKLKLVSKELPELILKPLKERAELQEAVPYSLSVGGGSQGLSERIILDYYDRTDYILPIEKYFAGTFIGDIKKFSFIPKQMDLNTINSLNE